MISCRTLGPVEVVVEGGPAPAELLWRKNLALLIYLARSPKRARTRDHLVGLLWGDKPESAARHSLNEAVRTLRKHLGEDALDSDGGQIRLCDNVVELDVDRFERLAADEDWRGASQLAAGEFMEGFGVPGCSDLEDWLYAERVAWRERSVAALVNRAEACLAGGELRDAAEAARWALSLDATSASSQRAVMRSLALAGDRAGALASYETSVARLEEEFGIEPDDETQALAERIRRGRAWKLPETVAQREGIGGESRRPPLVGREAELERLLDMWASCRTGRHATLAVIQGDPGTGKTRLAEELLARARLDGAAAASARAVQADLNAEWSGALALARGELLDAKGIKKAPSSAVAAFAGHLPEWRERFGVDEGSESELPLGRALTDVLRAAAAEEPVLLLLDDAQWLDRESLLALAAIVRDLARNPLFLLIAAAPHPERAELVELRSQIGRDLTGVVVRLAPLSHDALRALARWALPTYNDVELDRVSRRVSTDSAGLPLLAVELLHAVALGLDLAGTRSAWPEPLRTLDQSLPGELPDTVVAAVRVGFRRLTRDGQAVLAAAAVLSERVTMETLQCATGLEGEALVAALDELEWQRWLCAESRGYSFVARIVREVVARDMLTAGQRQRIVEMAGENPTEFA